MGTPDSITMAMAGQLEVTPPELQFSVKVGDYSKRQMRLNNLGKVPIAYKIKTTNPKEYFVRPNQGVVQPKERAIIQVMMGKLSQLPKEKCKGNIPAEDKFDWKKEVTEKTPNADISECRLRCVFQVDDPAGPTTTSPGPADKPTTSVTNSGVTQRKQSPAVADVGGGGGAAVAKPSEKQPHAAPMHSYSMYLIVAVMFFLVGRFTHHLEIPGL